MTFFSRARYWLPLLPLIGLLGVTYWLNLQVQQGPTTKDSNRRHDPDAIVENFSATRLNEQGVPSFIMAAKKMLHYPDDNSTTLDEPRITMLSDEQPAIHVLAKRATISRNGDEVFLHDNVEVMREASRHHDSFELQTEYLRIVPDQNLADSDRAVTIVDAHNVVHATGMELNNNTRILKLLSRVRSDHVPTNKQ
jgi:lipopolysaccharide export system protein LptC